MSKGGFRELPRSFFFLDLFCNYSSFDLCSFSVIGFFFMRFEFLCFYQNIPSYSF